MEIAPDEDWLCKPIASAAGRRIHHVAHGYATDVQPPVYYQRYVPGDTYAAVFVAADRGCCLLGVTRQWIGVGDTAAGRFQYVGSCGPVRLSKSRQRLWTDIGNVVASEFCLRGLFGVDAVEHGRDTYVVEVNPRITASVEILERTLQWNAWQMHFDACRRGRIPEGIDIETDVVAAKRILFATRSCQIRAEDLDWLERQNAGLDWPSYADLPAEPQTIPANSPVMTVLAGPLPGDDARTRLEQQVQFVRRRLRCV